MISSAAEVVSTNCRCWPAFRDQPTSMRWPEQSPRTPRRLPARSPRRSEPSPGPRRQTIFRFRKGVEVVVEVDHQHRTDPPRRVSGRRSERRCPAVEPNWRDARDAEVASRRKFYVRRIRKREGRRHPSAVVGTPWCFARASPSESGSDYRPGGHRQGPSPRRDLEHQIRSDVPGADDATGHWGWAFIALRSPRPCERRSRKGLTVDGEQRRMSTLSPPISFAMNNSRRPRRIGGQLTDLPFGQSGVSCPMLFQVTQARRGPWTYISWARGSTGRRSRARASVLRRKSGESRDGAWPSRRRLPSTVRAPSVVRQLEDPEPVREATFDDSGYSGRPCL